MEEVYTQKVFHTLEVDTRRVAQAATGILKGSHILALHTLASHIQQAALRHKARIYINPAAAAAAINPPATTATAIAVFVFVFVLVAIIMND